jgi:hypothetical protein
MFNQVSTERLPNFLESFENLTTHFDEHFGDLGSNERGDTFLDLALKVISLTEEGQDFPALQLSAKKSYDGGVDLFTSETSDGRILCAQSKYKIRGKEQFDNILSKFYDYETSLQPPESQLTLWSLPDDVDYRVPIPTFAIATSSKLEVIVRRYEQSTLTSREYYRKLLNQKRLFIIDGPRILTLLQNLYKKTHLIPSNMSLRSRNGWLTCDNVWFGTVAGADLVDLYSQHGDSLFFENIRDFLGTTSGKVVTTRSTVNQEIISTVSTEPGKMLARNNGITFRATDVRITDDFAELSMAAIVNGCQTTMCLVHCAPVSAECLVQVKVVRTTDAWDIAKAANYQNPVTRVDLDLARYLRPQLVRRVAMALGYAVESEVSVSASSVLNAIYRTKIDYEELKLLALGLFSRKPNNLFEGNYTELRGDILERLYDLESGEETVFAVLLMLLKESRVALRICEYTYSGEEYAPLFRRFYDDDKPRYRVYFAIAAIAALLRDDLSDRSNNPDKEFERTNWFLARAHEALENRSHDYHDAFVLTFQAIADWVLDIQVGKPEMEIAQNMYNKISTTAFSSLFRKILMRMDADNRRRSLS